MRIFEGLASVRVDHGVGVVCVAVLSSNEVPSGSCITGSGNRRKTGWLGHGAGDLFQPKMSCSLSFSGM